MLGSWVATLMVHGEEDSLKKFNVEGVIALGFPFDGYNDIRTSLHLDDLIIPTLIISGEFDMFA